MVTDIEFNYLLIIVFNYRLNESLPSDSSLSYFDVTPDHSGLQSPKHRAVTSPSFRQIRDRTALFHKIRSRDTGSMMFQATIGQSLLVPAFLFWYFLLPGTKLPKLLTLI